MLPGFTRFQKKPGKILDSDFTRFTRFFPIVLELEKDISKERNQQKPGKAGKAGKCSLASSSEDRYRVFQDPVKTRSGAAGPLKLK